MAADILWISTWLWGLWIWFNLNFYDLTFYMSCKLIKLNCTFLCDVFKLHFNQTRLLLFFDNQTRFFANMAVDIVWIFNVNCNQIIDIFKHSNLILIRPGCLHFWSIQTHSVQTELLVVLKYFNSILIRPGWWQVKQLFFNRLGCWFYSKTNPFYEYTHGRS